MSELNMKDIVVWYDELIQLEKDAQVMVKRLQKLHTSFEEIMKMNSDLALENKNLRDQLMILQEKDQEEVPTDNEPKLSRSRQNLEKLYDDGVHVCNTYFGSRRLENEPCVFCTEVIYGDR